MTARERWTLLRSQVEHDLRLRYVGSVAGVYWSILNPAIQLAVAVLLVTFVFRAPGHGDRLATVAFLFAGLSPWLAMQEGLVAGSSSIVRHAAIVKNVVFPLELLPLSAVVCSLVSFAVSLAGALGLALAAGASPGAAWLALPLLMAVQLTLTLGLVYGLAALCTFARDVGQILPVLLQALLFATPVLYRLEDMPARLRPLATWNPLHPLIDGYRGVLLRGELPDPAGLAYAVGASVVAAIVGLWLFRRTKGYFEAVL